MPTRANTVSTRGAVAPLANDAASECFAAATGSGAPTRVAASTTRGVGLRRPGLQDARGDGTISGQKHM